MEGTSNVAAYQQISVVQRAWNKCSLGISQMKCGSASCDCW